MNRSHQADLRPQRILLATDLSARCDRALDRAVQLAHTWGAELVAVNVQEVGGTPDQILAWASGANEGTMRELAFKELQRNTEDVHIPITLRVERGGEAHEVIHRVADEVHAGLIVTSVARDEFLGRFLLGSNVDALAKTVSQPLLVVRQRGRLPYQRIVLATTLSPNTVARLHALLQLFPAAQIDLFHADETPLNGLRNHSQPLGSGSQAAQEACEAILAKAGLAHTSAINIVCLRGELNDTLPAYARAHDVDMVVLGAPKPSNFVDNLWRSPSLDALKWLPCDAVLLPV